MKVARPGSAKKPVAATKPAARAPAKSAPRRKAAAMLPPASAYFFEDRQDREERHTLSVLVDNEPGVLARVIGLFSGRGYNIDSLTVSETEHSKQLSRITVVTNGTPMVLAQIKNQLERLVPVHSVTDLTADGNPLERELALVKISGTGDRRVEALRIADAFRAEVVGASTEHFIFQLTGRTDKIEQFVAIMAPLGLVEVCRTGIAALGRGPEAMNV
jgi:acetolactate synthase I/III small subunit